MNTLVKINLPSNGKSTELRLCTIAEYCLELSPFVHTLHSTELIHKYKIML